MHAVPLSRRRFFALSGAAAAGALCARLGLSAEPAKDAKELAKAINTFAGDLHTQLAKAEKGSLFFSPFSIETALAMTAAGARGKTLEEMQQALRLPNDPHANFGELLKHINATDAKKKRGYELTTANAIWAQAGYPWRKEFMELTRKHYGAGVVEVDFAKSEAARTRINAWVEKETKEKIKELIPEGIIDALTRMVLTNAIYFKGTWQYTFDKKNTKDAPFTLDDGKTKVDVPMMHLTGEFNYGTGNNFVFRKGEPYEVLELPYSGNELSMLIFLPKTPDAVHRLSHLPENIPAAKLKKQEVKVYLPKFKVESNFSLKPILMNLGMKAAFAPNTADFSGMHTGMEKLFITAVLHKAFVDVNEEGTEAAAATAVVVGNPGAPPPPKVFRADRPFAFAIRDNKTGTTLFQGRYLGPPAK
ncbi:MAG: serpin family protein [Planctomycetia bacterium]|nr:serpin family protein [Planctomycetia bacterium]